MLRRDRVAPRRPLPAIATVAAVGALAAVTGGAADMTSDEPKTTPTAGTVVEAAVPPADTAALRARLSQVNQVSRSSDRPDLASLAPAASRLADNREQLIDGVEQSADEYEEQIQREIERRRELARQRRIEAMNDWVLPVSGYEITATFGDGGSLWSSDHTGLDLATSEGSPVGSVATGEVTSTGYDGSYGNTVEVTHEDGTVTWYCHLSSISVGVGESVEPGTTIGAVGSTGNSTGPHLHLEVHPGGGDPVDPYAYLEEQGAF